MARNRYLGSLDSQHKKETIMDKINSAEILSVGTELLLGDIVNTNARFLSVELAKLGINVYFETVAGDNAGRLKSAFEAAFSRADMVVATGGLGPTADDLTKETGAAFFGRKLVLHEETLGKMKSFFKSINRKMTDNNVKQAMFPENSVILPNNNGTAPGCVIAGNGKTLIMLPGPPHEMEPMFRESVTPYLKQRTDSILVSRTLLFNGIGESALENELRDMIDAQTNPTIATYAKPNGVSVRITAKTKNEEEANSLISPVADEIYACLGAFIYGEGETTPEQAAVAALKSKNLKISCAESCTGGLLAASLISVAGASDVFLEGIISYSNESKIKRLNVSEKTLDNYGAVSARTAAEMAKGAAETLGADIGVSTTGIAGPSGATDDKPVGLVYIGLYINGSVKTRELHLSGNRQRIRERSVSEALRFLLEEIKNTVVS